MKMIEISKEKFYEFVKNNEYNNYCQTSEFGMVMGEEGYDYSFIAYTTDENEILAAGMFLIKKIGSFYYAYSPRGFIIDYKDNELVRKFTRNLIKYYKRKNVIFLKINPLIPIATIDANNEYEKTNNDNHDILDNLKSLGFKRRKETKPLDLLEPRLTNIIDLKEFNIENFNEDIKKKLTISINNGLELYDCNAKEIDFIYNIDKTYLKKDVNYYRNLYNTFKKENNADLLCVKVNYENFLINVKKRTEEAQIINDKLNEEFLKNRSDYILVQKMKSDKDLEKCKQDLVYATEGLKTNKDDYIAGALIIKNNNRITVILSNEDPNYNYLYPLYFLYYKIIEKYKDDYNYLDFYGIADDFQSTASYKFNKTKIEFNNSITEYIGELDLIINKWKFKIVEKNNSLSNEFNNQKRSTK